MKAKPLPLAYYNFLGSKTVPVVCLLRINAFLPDLLQDSVQCTLYTVQYTQFFLLCWQPRVGEQGE